MSEGKVYEMLWDCQFCGTKKNLGLTHRFCPNCGAPQNPDARYYPSDEDKVAVQDHEYVGVDVTCPNCNDLNSAASEYCGQCGAPLSEGAKAKRLEEQSVREGQAFESSGSRDLVKEEFEAEMAAAGVKPKRDDKQRGGLSMKWLALIGVIVALIVGGIFLFTRTTETQVVVSGHEWERSIEIEQYSNFTTRSWRDSPPIGDNVSIRVGSCTREQRDTRRVPDGQDCRTVRRDQGDGTYREERVCETRYREEPVYDDMCTWTGQRWEDSRTETASGDSVNDTPTWPDVSLNCEDQRRVGCERIASENERYTVIYNATEDDHEYRCDFPQDTWEDIRMESIWSAQVRQFARGSLLCDTLEQR